jgi:hypothetical protein
MRPKRSSARFRVAWSPEYSTNPAAALECVACPSAASRMSMIVMLVLSA